MEHKKALDPDGFPAAFYQNFRQVIKADIFVGIYGLQHFVWLLHCLEFKLQCGSIVKITGNS